MAINNCKNDNNTVEIVEEGNAYRIMCSECGSGSYGEDRDAVIYQWNLNNEAV
jgi:hypothetical protein